MEKLDLKLSQLDWKIDESLIPDLQKILVEVENSDSIQFQTSGSTGVPKQISFSLKQVQHSAQRTAKAFQLESGDKVFSALPAIYVAGKMMVLRALYQNWQLHWQRPSAIPLVHGEYDFGVFTVAQVVAMLDVNARALDGFKRILLGGGALTNYAEELLVKTGIPCYIGYGMTETLTHIALKKIGEIGGYESLPGVELAVSEQGCLNINDTLLNTGWLQTNDVVELSEAGFSVLGRIDFVINTGGVKVYPEKIESRLASIISADYFVIGRMDDVLGEHIVVVVEGSEDEELRQELLNLNWGVEKPREIIFKTILPRTESGKIKRTL